MKISVLKPIGFCGGVRNAINIAKKARADFPRKRVIIVGLLVSNSQVIEELAKEGIETFYDPKLPNEKLVSAIPYGACCVFPCYGHDEKLEEICHRRGIRIYDAICPKVKTNINKIKGEIMRGHQVIYVGEHRHDETKTALSISKDVLLYDINQRFDYLDVIDFSPCVVNQSTLNVLNLTNIHQDIYSCLPNARIEEEICSTTRLRQQAIIDLDPSVDLIVIVGEEISCDTAKLFEIAKISHPTATSILVSKESDIDDSLFIDKKHVAIASGSATPLAIIETVISHIRNIKN